MNKHWKTFIEIEFISKYELRILEVYRLNEKNPLSPRVLLELLFSLGLSIGYPLSNNHGILF